MLAFSVSKSSDRVGLGRTVVSADMDRFVCVFAATLDPIDELFLAFSLGYSFTATGYDYANTKNAKQFIRIETKESSFFICRLHYMALELIFKGSSYLNII